ncbi:MAG: 6-carboxytetrahydropterin synthase [Phycisphaerales bacterium]|nr:6-carboxytetrahydropterin synthase [Phycisphaerales bacterium]
MFQISVEREFCAAHALRIRQTREATHGHNFKLVVTLEGPALDADGLLLDFHALETLVDHIIAPMRNGNLNEIPPFSGGLNPSAEEIARHIANRVRSGLPGLLVGAPAGVRLASVRLTEAPGCAVLYLPDGRD